jgi:hypothetical protein
VKIGLGTDTGPWFSERHATGHLTHGGTVRTQQEILKKFEESYMRDLVHAPASDERLCNCNAFAFQHLRFAGDCQGQEVCHAEA